MRNYPKSAHFDYRNYSKHIFAKMGNFTEL